jgi:hypothetical protein
VYERSLTLGIAEKLLACEHEGCSAPVAQEYRSSKQLLKDTARADLAAIRPIRGKH